MNALPRTPKEGTEEPASSRYFSGLDGLRGVGIIFVLLYHGGFTALKGSFLAVSMFFTLSGFLITFLLLDQVRATGRVDLKRFLIRRLRRLGPASYVCLLLVTICSPWFAAAEQPVRLRGDLLATMFYGANWRFVLNHRSYADMFIGGVSPVLHYWSLALEEQIYLLMPIVMIVTFALAKRWRRPWLPAAALGVLTALSVMAGFLTNDLDLGYYGTHVRAAEVLMGCLAAFLVQHIGLENMQRKARPWAISGFLALVGFVVLLVEVERTKNLVLRGGLPVLAVLWCVLTIGAMVPGPSVRVLSLWPLVQLGRITFSLYLYHWPVFLLLTPERLDIGRWPLFGVRFVVTLALALASFHLVEHPIRTGRWRLRRWRGALAYAAIVSVTIVVAVAQLRPAAATTFDAMLHSPDDVVDFGDGTVREGPLQVVIVGNDAAARDRVLAVAGEAGARIVDLVDPGCSVLAADHDCAAPAERLGAHLATADAPDVVVLTVGAADHDAAAARIAEARAIGDDEAFAEYDEIDAELAFVNDLYAAMPPTAQLQLVDAAPQEAGSVDPVGAYLESASLRLTEVANLTTDALTPSLFQPVASSVPRTKVMVIGDSASYGVAIELDHLAGDEFDVLWAGRHNCPLVPAVAVKWWEGVEFDTRNCLPIQGQWPSLIAQFQPDVVLAVVSLPEHSDQRYTGDSRWYHIGDERYTAVHEQWISGMLAELQPSGASLLLANSSYSPSSASERVDAWNAQLAEWDERWSEVAMVDVAGPIEAAEEAAGHSLRPDALHLDDATLQMIIRTVYVPAIERAVAGR